eukprot:jgi/Mesvir1/25708/Mv01902-RA.3
MVSSRRTKNVAPVSAAFTCITCILIGFYPEIVTTTDQTVSTETGFREALANIAIDNIYILSSFSVSGLHAIVVDHSVNIFGNCSGSALDTPGCTLTIDNSGPAHILHIQSGVPALTVHIKGIWFSGPQGTSSHGAIQCSGAHGSAVLVKDSSFHGLRSENGGAFLVTGAGCVVTCTDCGFTDNGAGDAGGAVYLQHGSFECHRCSFSDNHAERGGAIYVTTGGHMQLYYPYFAGNVAATGGADVFIESLPFAALSFCPSSPHPNSTRSPRAPIGSPSCETDYPPPATPLDVETLNNPPVALPGLATNSTGPDIPAPDGPTVPAAFSPRSPPGPSALYIYPTWGVSQVPTEHFFSLVGILTINHNRFMDAVLNLTVGPWEGSEGSCSSFLFQHIAPSQGSCFRPGNTAACTVVCYLGQVRINDPVSLDMTLRAVTVGAQLVMEATVEALGQAREVLPVQVTDAFGVPAEPIRVVDTLQPIIAPAQGEAHVRHLAGGPHLHACAGTADVLHFTVIGPALGGCNLTEAIRLVGAGQVASVTAGVDDMMLMAFEVLALPDSALVLQVAAGACRDADGQPSKASEPFPLLVDVSKPSVTATSIGRRSAEHDLAVFRIQFSERVSGFTAEVIEVQGGQLTCLLPVSAAHGTYEAIVTPWVGNGSLSIFVKEDAAEDVAGNPSTASNVSRSQIDDGGSLGKAISTSLKCLAGISLLMSGLKSGPGRPAAFIGQLQFFQMMSALDVPLSSFLGDLLYNLAWVNNAWPRPLFGMGGAPQYAASGSSGSFASNGSCRGQADEDAVTAGNSTQHRRHLGDTLDGGWRYMNLAELDSLLQDNHPLIQEAAVPGAKGLPHLTSQGDVGAIVLLCLCQLAGCLALRAACIVLWRTMNRFRPSQWWETLPAILLFPCLELLVLMLTFPTVTQACVYYATAGFDWGVLIGACVGAAYPLAFVTFVTYFLVANILRNNRCVFRPRRVYFMQGGARDPFSTVPSRGSDTDEFSSGRSSLHSELGVSPVTYRKPYLLKASWLDRGATVERNAVRQPQGPDQPEGAIPQHFPQGRRGKPPPAPDPPARWHHDQPHGRICLVPAYEAGDGARGVVPASVGLACVTQVPARARVRGQRDHLGPPGGVLHAGGGVQAVPDRVPHRHLVTAPQAEPPGVDPGGHHHRLDGVPCCLRCACAALHLPVHERLRGGRHVLSVGKPHLLPGSSRDRP